MANKITNPVMSVKMTGDTFDRINAYAYIVSDLIGKPTEVMGLLLSAIDDTTCTATEAYLISDQEVTGWEAHPKKGILAKAYVEARKKSKKVVGMWHSHGSYSNFHSTFDDAHLKVLLIKNTYILPNRLNFQNRSLPYAASIVINNESYQRENPAERPVKKQHYFCCAAIQDERKNQRIIDDLVLELVPGKTQPTSDYEIRNEVCKKVIFRGKYLSQVLEERNATVLEEEVRENSIVSSFKAIYNAIFRRECRGETR